MVLFFSLFSLFSLFPLYTLLSSALLCSPLLSSPPLIQPLYPLGWNMLSNDQGGMGGNFVRVRH